MSYDLIFAEVAQNPFPIPEGERIVYGGVHIRKYVVAAGTGLISHCHTYDHPSILASGEIELWTQDGGVEKFVAPAEIKIAAGIKHAIAAITDSVWYCIHAGVDEPQTEGAG